MASVDEPQGMQPRFVALLDVLGFKSLISGGVQAGRLRGYLRCVKDAMEARPSQPVVDFVVFSDSIVLTTRDDQELSLMALMKRCSVLFAALLEMEIAIRGAIAYGPCYRTEAAGSVFLAGNPIIEAYEFESQQDWVGIMLTPSVLKQVNTLPDSCAMPRGHSTEEMELFRQRIAWAAFVHEGPIPFKAVSPFEDNRFSGFAIIPGDGSTDHHTMERTLGRSMEQLQRMKILAPTPQAQAKYSRTIDWLRIVKQDWAGAANTLVHLFETPRQ